MLSRDMKLKTITGHEQHKDSVHGRHFYLKKPKTYIYSKDTYKQSQLSIKEKKTYINTDGI